jgi:hypothetical protein
MGRNQGPEAVQMVQNTTKCVKTFHFTAYTTLIFGLLSFYNPVEILRADEASIHPPASPVWEPVNIAASQTAKQL